MYVLRSSISVSTKLFTHRKSVFMPIMRKKTGIFRDKKMIFFFCLLRGLRGGGSELGISPKKLIFFTPLLSLLKKNNLIIIQNIMRS